MPKHQLTNDIHNNDASNKTLQKYQQKKIYHKNKSVPKILFKYIKYPAEYICTH